LTLEMGRADVAVQHEKNFCDELISLYIRRSPHQSRKEVFAQTGRIFCRLNFTVSGDALL
jgi:hypothetical protein